MGIILTRGQLRKSSKTCASNFGIELDDVTTEKAIIRKEKHLGEEVPSQDEEIIYKIDIPGFPANRYDLLFLEGLSKALCIFNKLDPIPTYKVDDVNEGSLLKMHVKPELGIN